MPSESGQSLLTIRALRQEDIPFADSIRAAAGWNQTLADWERFLACAPQGCFLAEYNGEPAGTATTIAYGPSLGWVGMMLVAPNQRRRGIGSALLRHAVGHLESQGVASVKLDATPLGEPVYRQFGFQPECQLTRWEAAQAPLGSSARSDVLNALRPADLSDVVRLDAASFGVGREQLVRALLKQSVRALCCRDNAGQTTGFGLLRSGSRAYYLGPIVASDRLDGAALVHALLAGLEDKPVFWDILNANGSAAQCAQALGFKPQRSLLRMFYRHPGPSSQPSWQWGIADPAVG